MIFKTIRLLEWRVAELEMEADALRMEVESLKMPHEVKVNAKKKTVE